jgi:hypothetical protein
MNGSLSRARKNLLVMPMLLATSIVAVGTSLIAMPQAAKADPAFWHRGDYIEDGSSPVQLVRDRDWRDGYRSRGLYDNRSYGSRGNYYGRRGFYDRGDYYGRRGYYDREDYYGRRGYYRRSIVPGIHFRIGF